MDQRVEHAESIERSRGAGMPTSHGLSAIPDDVLRARVEALAIAIATLLGADLAGLARPLAEELVLPTKAARPPGAEIISLAATRRGREQQR